MKKLLIRTAVILLSIVITLLVLESGIRLFYKFRFEPKESAHISAPWLYRLSQDKHLLYELIPGAEARIKRIDYKINAFGFRDQKYRERKAHEKRIIAVGDSLTFGWDLPLQDTYHKQVEALMISQGKSVEVYGMGVVGYNTEQEYQLIKNNVLRFAPDMLVLQVCPNDFERKLSIRISPDEKRFALTPYHDFSIPYVFTKSSGSRFLMRHSYLFRFLNLKISWLKKKREKNYAPKEVFLLGEERSLSYIKKIKNYLDKNSIPFSVVLFPFRQIEDLYPYTSLHDRIHKLLEEIEVPYLDLHEKIGPRLKDQDIWLDRLHLNAEGNAAAAQKILEFLDPLLFNTADR